MKASLPALPRLRNWRLDSARILSTRWAKNLAAYEKSLEKTDALSWRAPLNNPFTEGKSA
jgi:hypothetical protein